MMHHRHNAIRQRGASLIEIMVGVVIGLIAILVIYQVFAASEGLRRNTTGVGDAQQNGLLSSFALGSSLPTPVTASLSSAQELYGCPNLSNDPAKSVRPVPVMIIDSGDSEQPDEFSVSTAHRSRWSRRSRSHIHLFRRHCRNLRGAESDAGKLNAFKKGDMVVTMNIGGGLLRAHDSQHRDRA